MGEPKFDERAKPAGSSAGGGAQSGGTTHGEKLRAQCRGKDFAQGEAAFCPDNAVQMKPDPGGKSKPATGRKRVAELEQQNADLAVGLALREVHGVGERARHAMNDRRDDQLATAQVNGALAEARAKLAAIPRHLGRIEALVEGMLDADEQRRLSDEAVDAAIAEHKKAQAPDLLDALGLVLDLASALKAVGKAANAVRLRSLAKSAAAGGPDVPKALDLFEAGQDAVGSPKSAIKSGIEVGDKRDKASGGDTSTKMVGALDRKADAIGRGLANIEDYLLDQGFGALSEDISSVELHVDEALNTASAFFKGLPAETQASLDDLGRMAADAGDSIEGRIGQLRRLVEARGRHPGGHQLARNTRGRRVFDAVASQPEAFTLVEQSQLDVIVDTSGKTTEQRRTSGYWLRCADNARREEVERFSLIPMPVLGRPEWATDDHVRLPPEVAGPLKSIIPVVVRPHDVVEVTGAGGWRTVPASTWGEEAQRSRLIQNLRVDRFEGMGGP